jgi:hypothetical protein
MTFRIKCSPEHARDVGLRDLGGAVHVLAFDVGLLVSRLASGASA